MSNNSVYLSLGSNMGDRYNNLKKTIKLISEHPLIIVEKKSSLYKSEPMYYKQQKNFYNMVVKIRTNCSPHILLKEFKIIEKIIGRSLNLNKNRERIIDVDIMLYDDVFINDDDLTIPHPRMLERNFVIYPLKEIEPNYYFIHLNKNINEIINAMDDTLEIIKLHALFV